MMPDGNTAALTAYENAQYHYERFCDAVEASVRADLRNDLVCTFTGADAIEALPEATPDAYAALLAAWRGQDHAEMGAILARWLDAEVERRVERDLDDELSRRYHETGR